MATELGKIAVLTGEQVSEERLTLTMAELSDIGPEYLRDAFALARKECKWFPKPAEIRELVKKANPSFGLRLHKPGESMS